MKAMIAVMVMAVAATVTAQEMNTLDTYRQSYERQQQSVLTQYCKALDSAMTDLKKQGDLDNVLILQTEQKRFDAEKTVPTPADAKDPFRPAAEAYYQAMVAWMKKYVTVLDALIKKEVAADRIEEAKAVKVEKDRASFVLADMQTKLPVKAEVTKPMTEKPEKPVPSPSAFKPKTYVDETRGFAGNPVESHNIYTFHVEQVGQQAKLKFWASGDIGTKTFGTVTVTPPGGDGHIAYKWQPKDFKVAANTVASYEKLRAITCNISKVVKEPGPYEVAFKWANGGIGLVILRVELEIK